MEGSKAGSDNHINGANIQFNEGSQNPIEADNKKSTFETPSSSPQPTQDKPAPNSSSKRIRKSLLFILPILMIILLLSGFFLYRIFFNKNQVIGTYPQETQPSETPTPTIATTAINAIEAHNTFGFNLLNKLSEEKTENVVISPLSISLAFSMVYNGADGETKSEMAKILQIDKITKEQLNQESQSLSQSLESADPKIEIAIANSIWARKGISFEQTFLNTNKTYYQAEVKELDFSLPSATDTINNWVSVNTKNKIDSIVEPPINPLMVMYLINAVYFKGTWNIEFDKTLTERKEFNINATQNVTADFMKQKRDDFSYFENDQFQAISLPYGESKKLSMYIFLPKASIASFSANLNLNNWNTWLNSFEEKEGTLELPRFKTEYESSIKEPLISLGMVKAFASSEASFSGIRSQKDIFISEAKHKTFIEVNEEGTEAAAVTSIGMALAALPSNEEGPFYMLVNKPFFFTIADSDTNQILFSGFIYNPSSN